MAKIKSLESIEIQSKVEGLEDVFYEVKVLSVKEKLNFGMRLNTEINNNKTQSVSASEEIMIDCIKNCVIKIDNLEFEDGTVIETGVNLIDAFEKTSSSEILKLVLEMQTFIAGENKEIEELKKN